jgi:hypothetical protein
MAIIISSLRGGYNDTDPPISLEDDQTTIAENVEYVVSTLGERRRGGDAISLTGSGLASCDRIVWLHRHLPSTNPADAQLWGMGITGSTAVLAYKDTTWHTVTMPDAPTVDGASEYQVRGITLHNKLTIAYNSAVDRLHTFDTRTSTTSLRRVGMAALSTAPTAVDTAVAGSYATVRYFRTRETVQVSGTTILRSEPSESLTFTPNGSFTGAVVTKPATVNSDPAATHWELEESLDDSNFYVVATTAIGTATATDTTAAGSIATFELSEDIGDYIPPHSGKFLIADEDRLIVFGAWEDAELSSSMSWTPVFNATGVGNDERIPLDPVSVINLDGYEGGQITDVSHPVAGEIWVFKQEHTYKVTRTGIRIRAYDSGGGAVSKDVGAISGSVVTGTDEAGNAALYFHDPGFGPYRTTRGGLQRCGRDIWNTFQTINLDASKVVARSLFYPTTGQVFWNIATDTANVPDFGLTLHTNEQRLTQGGEARRGWTTRTGASCGALTMCLFADNIDDGVARSQVLVPFIGVEGGGLIWRMDTGDDDNGTEFSAQIRTKPYAIGDLQTEVELKSATLVAKAQADATLLVSAVPNYDEDSVKVAGELDLSPEASEAQVTRFMDDLSIAECTTVQIDFADTATPGERWELARFAMTVTSGLGS